MPPVRLNVFQKLVLQWEKLHPYNGAQVVHVEGLPPEDLAERWSRTLASLGLGSLNLSAGAYGFDRRGADGIESHAEGTPLETVLTAHLNRKYSDSETPLRLIVVPRGDRTYFLVVAYRHFVADSVSIRLVIESLFDVICDPTAPPPDPVEWSAGGYWKLFGPRTSGGSAGWSLPAAAVAAARQTWRMKRVRRVESRSADFRVEFTSHRIPDGVVDRALAFARGQRLRLNDVLLAAIALALREHGPLGETSKRTDFALGSIVDLRPHARQTDRPRLQRAFNLYLGFSTAFLTPEQMSDLATAARALGEQHRRLRESNSGSASMLRMGAGLLAHRLFRSPATVAEWYRKRVPLSVGISNINLRPQWPQRHFPSPLLDYFRVSPTGPLMPLVFSATTLGPRLHLGLTRRADIIAPEMAKKLVGHITRTLTRL